jgi:hypothetical protein
MMFIIAVFSTATVGIEAIPQIEQIIALSSVDPD